MSVCHHRVIGDALPLPGAPSTAGAQVDPAGAVADLPEHKLACELRSRGRRQKAAEILQRLSCSPRLTEAERAVCCRELRNLRK